MIYADSNILIRLLEGEPATRSVVEGRLVSCRGQAGSLMTSNLSRLECRCKLLRSGDLTTLSLYDGFFLSPEVCLLSITDEVIEKATALRAKWMFSTPDAIHLATAIVAEASVFLTGDKQLRQCTAIKVELI